MAMKPASSRDSCKLKVIVIPARVEVIFPDTPPEKALAAVTRGSSVMLARGSIAAYSAVL